MQKEASKYGWAAVALTLGTVSLVSDASAVEVATPVLPGVTAGIPAGAAPPPGIYFSETSLYWQSRSVDSKGRDVPYRLNFFETLPTFFVVPNVEILGANYSFYISQSFSTNAQNSFGQKDGKSGNFNTLFSPINLSWNLGSGFYFSSGAAVFFPNGKYRREAPSNGNPYTTLQPNFALTYLKDGWNFTGNLIFDFNAKNNITSYQSGNILSVDYTGTKSFGPWTVGMQGFYLKQYESDKINGNVVAATAYSGRGNKIQQLALGPYVAYDFGKFAIAIWYDHSVSGRNGVSPNIAWLKVAVPLGDPFSAATSVTPTQLPDRTQR